MRLLARSGWRKIGGAGLCPGGLLRNIFDQYSQPENRVTHALMTALDKDRVLLAGFLRDLVKVKAPGDVQKLSVLEQQYPGEEEESSEEDLERRGIPDGWIFNDEGWCVLIESKVLMRPRADQIQHHRRTAERRGFEHVTAVAIAPHPFSALPAGTVLLEWREIYAWLRRQPRQPEWAALAAEYLEIAEAKLIDAEQFVEGTLTKFAGFPFGPDHPFTYLEGKRVLRLALGELRKSPALRKRLGMDPTAKGRPAIIGRQEDRIWDFLSLPGASDSDTFTRHLHLTLGVGAQTVEAMVTVPNAVNSTMRSNIVRLGLDGFRDLAREVLQTLAPLLRNHPGAKPWFRGVQRRYSSQRAKPHLDAAIEFDLRTAIPSSGLLKLQPR